ncbi:cyanate transporter [Arvimicrobium flavum]|uniref:cyanate transporter n=1 Tax=Arvimicrobium flavum TaxID=3393320 RepID=UPI00237AB854|nr:cyanate transporter [Mesorhizobium shangrilense]
MSHTDRPAPGRQWTLLALIVLIGLNLRPFLTGPGPLLSLIEADTGMGFRGLAMLTLLPMLLMGVGAFFAPGIQAAVGTRRALLAALLVLALGSLLRLVVPGGVTLVMTAALCGAGVAVIQAAVPGIIKAHFAGSVSGVTGLYSAMLMAGGALGARLSPLLAGQNGDWRAGLAWLAVPAAVALVAAFSALANSAATAPDRLLAVRLLRRPRTWTLMVAFGLVNGGYSSMVAWLAPYYQARGWNPAESGSLVAVMAVSQAMSAIAMPLIAGRGIDRRPWLLLTLAMQATGFLGLAFVPNAAPMFWVAICGAGLGGGFALAMVTALDHLARPEQAGALAALMQGGGFVIAATAPLATALLQGWSGSFATGWIMHLAWVAVTVALYMRFDPAGYARVMGVPATSGAIASIPAAVGELRASAPPAGS